MSTHWSACLFSFAFFLLLFSIWLASQPFRCRKQRWGQTSPHLRRSSFAWCSELMASSSDLYWRSSRVSWGTVDLDSLGIERCQRECYRKYLESSCLGRDWIHRSVRIAEHPKTRCRKDTNNQRLPHLVWLCSESNRDCFDSSELLQCRRYYRHQLASRLRELSILEFHISWMFCRFVASLPFCWWDSWIWQNQNRQGQARLFSLGP